jgi:hypothetical protein
MKTIDERQGYCEGCGGIDICTCNDLDWTEDDYDYPYEASMGRLGYVWCEQCNEFAEEPHGHITESGHAEGW